MLKCQVCGDEMILSNPNRSICIDGELLRDLKQKAEEEKIKFIEQIYEQDYYCYSCLLKSIRKSEEGIAQGKFVTHEELLTDLHMTEHELEQYKQKQELFPSVLVKRQELRILLGLEVGDGR